MTTVSLHPHRKGRTFTRGLIARALGDGDPESFALHRWGGEGALVVKALQGATTTTDTGNAEAAEFFGLVLEASLLGRLAGLRRVPFNVRMLAMVAGATGYWVAEHAPIPMRKQTLDGASLSPLKVAAIIAATRESLAAGGQAAEDGLQRDLVRAIAAAVDGAFIDAGNTGVAGERPAAVTSGITAVPATGNPSTDLAALVDAFGGDLSAAYLVTDPTTATELALARDAAGAFLFPDCGPRGGSVLGIPLVCSRGSPRASSGGQIALVDPISIAHNADDLGIARATSATLLMSDTPDSTPTRVSLFQTDTVAFKAVMRANWRREQADGVAVLTGASY